MKLIIRVFFALLLSTPFFCQATFAQSGNSLQVADSLYSAQNWKAAKEKYVAVLGDTSKNGGAWNRLGNCNHNLGLYQEAIADYQKALACKIPPPVRSTAMVRMAKAYSMMNKTDEAGDWLIKATSAGYNSLPDVDSIADFKNVRASATFKDTRKQIYEIVYPCAKEPHNHDFDFWIGDWDCMPTGTTFVTGHSRVESMAGGCAVLENFTSNQQYTGKSFNFYDPAKGKWEQDWVGSGGAVDRNRYTDGEYKDGAMHFKYDAPDAKGNRVLGNFIFYNIDKDTARQYLELSKDGGKTYQVSYDLTYKRKKN